ncbi:MAG: aldehyde dehydrogenase family protein [Acidimicrobiales bacterium]
MVTSTVEVLGSYPLSKETRDFLDHPVFGHVIGGEVLAAESGETTEVFDPSSGALIGHGALGTAGDIDRAVKLATEAFDDGRWRDLRPSEKENRLHRFAELIHANAVTISELDTLDAGIQSAFTAFYMNLAMELVDYFAGWPSKLHGTIPDLGKGLSVQLRREPIGVVGLITPWNAPGAAAVYPVQALAAGNCVILKPAEQTPMSAMLIGQLYAEAGIPDGVLSVVQGDGSTGAALVAHPSVGKIHFTGSVETGKKIQASAAQTLKMVDLELGGKSANIVFADADLGVAAPTVQSGVWNNSGQVCTAGTRVLVERSIHDELVASMIESSKRLKIGGAFDPATEMGPLISAEQLERVTDYVSIGESEGAKLALGGQRIEEGGGYYFSPTIFTSVDNSMRIAQEEIFGPVMSVIPFDSEEEAYAIANDSEYGLSAGVWTRDLDRAERASRSLEAGTVWVNTYQEVEPSVPYGGVKHSGFGRTLGQEAVEGFTQTKTVWVRSRS